MILPRVSSYRTGLITEFIGKIRIDNRAYYGDPSISPMVSRKHMMINGTQQRKSVRIMTDIFLCKRLFLLRTRSPVTPWDRLKDEVDVTTNTTK